MGFGCISGAALLGLKPLVDGYKIIFGIQDEATNFDPATNFAISRMFETGVESIPQACLQSLALVALDAAEPTAGQYVSIAWSVLNIAYSFVDVAITMDKSKVFSDEPLLFGFIEESKENAMAFTLGLFSEEGPSQAFLDGASFSTANFANSFSVAADIGDALLFPVAPVRSARDGGDPQSSAEPRCAARPCHVCGLLG